MALDGDRQARRTSSRKMLLTLAFFALVALAGLGAVTLARGLPDDANTRAEQERRQDDLLKQLLRGFTRGRIAEASIGVPPSPFDESEDVAAVPGPRWIVYKIRADDKFDYKRGKWQALVASGLMRDLSETSGLPPIVGHSFTILRPNGAEEYDAASTIFASSATGSPEARVDHEYLKDVVRGKAAEVAAKLVELRTEKPLDRSAPEVILSVDSPKAFAANLYNNIWEIVGPLNGERERPLTEGAYVEVRDTIGRLVAISAYSVRTAQGTGIVSPEYVAEAGTASVGGRLKKTR
jgi:hypothetical protein